MSDAGHSHLGLFFETMAFLALHFMWFQIFNPLVFIMGWKDFDRIRLVLYKMKSLFHF
jgi:hypothetical protein